MRVTKRYSNKGLLSRRYRDMKVDCGSLTLEEAKSEAENSLSELERKFLQEEEFKMKVKEINRLRYHTKAYLEEKHMEENGGLPPSMTPSIDEIAMATIAAAVAKKPVSMLTPRQLVLPRSLVIPLLPVIFPIESVPVTHTAAAPSSSSTISNTSNESNISMSTSTGALSLLSTAAEASVQTSDRIVSGHSTPLEQLQQQHTGSSQDSIAASSSDKDMTFELSFRDHPNPMTDATTEENYRSKRPKLSDELSEVVTTT